MKDQKIGCYIRTVYDSKEEMDKDLNEFIDNTLIINEEDLEVYYDLSAAASSMGSCSSVESRPKQLPPHIKVKVSVELGSENKDDLFGLIDEIPNWIPAAQPAWVTGYTLAQVCDENVDEDTTAWLLVNAINYIEEEKEEEELEEALF